MGKESALGLSNALRILAPLALFPMVVGCAEVSYRDRSTLSHTRYATVENFGDEQIAAEQIGDLLEEVAEILDVTLSPDKPKVRVMVMPAARIADLYRQVVTVASHGADARALYLPGANLVAIPYYSRTILGHELAHYLTDHYLKSTPRWSWERIALMVEDALPDTPRIVARRSPESHAHVTATPYFGWVYGQGWYGWGWYGGC
jgi:hypothetical protein